MMDSKKPPKYPVYDWNSSNDKNVFSWIIEEAARLKAERRPRRSTNLFRQQRIQPELKE